MNRTSPIKPTSIAENCRSILRERYCIQQSCNYTDRLNTFSQQGRPLNTRKSCHPIPTNPIYSPYGVNNIQVSAVNCEKSSSYNTFSGLCPTIPSNNYIRQPNCINRNTVPMKCYLNRPTNYSQRCSTSSDNCIQMITNTIINKIRYKIPQEEIAILCCCLPSLIQQILCKSPWLTPNDIIQCLSADIIKEAMNCFDHDYQNIKNEFHKPKQDYNIKETPSRQQRDNKVDDNHAIQTHEDNDDSLSSYRSTNVQQTPLPQQSSRSGLDLPINDQEIHRKKKNTSRSPSTRSFTSQQSKSHKSGSQQSTTPSTWSTEIKSQKSERDTPVYNEEDQRSFTSHNQDPNLSVDTFDSNEEFDEKNMNLTPKSKSITSASRIHFDYPGKKDPNAIQDVEKCLAFYHKIREYFDDDVAAMLLKCCLCYGGCSGQR